jgi:2-polyprenyl-3-methyl-5-hydroxy-6-metoxy-1,4-benzoquinol methylase
MLKNPIVEYYNNYTHQLLNDYIKNNKRVDTALKGIIYLIDLIKPSKVLDLGCGIGWSSFEISRHFPEIKIEAFDLSSDLIRIGLDIFEAENLKFEVKDLTKEEKISSKKFEFVCMIDVFEHIPSEARNNFGKSLKRVLGDKFMLFLSCPTISMQNHLKATNPSAIQPVDEDINEQILQEFSTILNANLIFYREHSIWRETDYLHAVISNMDERLNIQYDILKFKPELREQKIKRILWSNQSKYLTKQNFKTKFKAKLYKLLKMH